MTAQSLWNLKSKVLCSRNMVGIWICSYCPQLTEFYYYTINVYRFSIKCQKNSSTPELSCRKKMLTKLFIQISCGWTACLWMAFLSGSENMFPSVIHLRSFTLTLDLDVKIRKGFYEEVTGAFGVNEQQLGNKWPLIMLTPDHRCEHSVSACPVFARASPKHWHNDIHSWCILGNLLHSLHIFTEKVKDLFSNFKL